MIDQGSSFHSERTTTLDSIAAVIGVEAAVRLSVLWGGQRVKIASNPGPTSKIAEAIGLEAAQKLGKAMGGNPIDVPLNEGKRYRIVMLRKENAAMTANEIAGAVGCGVRHVYQVLADHAKNPLSPELAFKPRDPNQFDMFGER